MLWNYSLKSKNIIVKIKISIQYWGDKVENPNSKTKSKDQKVRHDQWTQKVKKVQGPTNRSAIKKNKETGEIILMKQQWALKLLLHASHSLKHYIITTTLWSSHYLCVLFSMVELGYE